MGDVYNHLPEEEKHDTIDNHYDQACSASYRGREPPAFIVAYHEVHKSMIYLIHLKSGIILCIKNYS